jgi:hypothetical protein
MTLDHNASGEMYRLLCIMFKKIYEKNLDLSTEKKDILHWNKTYSRYNFLFRLYCTITYTCLAPNTLMNGIRKLRQIWDTTCIVYIYCAGIKREYLKRLNL